MTQQTHFRDIAPHALDAMLARTLYPALLRELASNSRAAFGFFPAHNPRALEYPWIAASLPSDVSGWRIADVGAGVNILPLWLARHGAHVITIDNHPLVRDIQARDAWNEWGFLDYASLDERVQSIHAPYETFASTTAFQCIYSVSVIEHVPRDVRSVWITSFHRQLSSGGLLLLTVDLIPNSDALWNLSEGKVVEDTSVHGDFSGLLKELGDAGFVVETSHIERDVPDSRVDIGFIRAVRR